MATYFDVHPVDPQPRSIAQVVRIMRDGGVVAYPTDSGFALGCQMGNQDGLARMRQIRQLDDKHHFTLLCKDFAQLGQLVHIDNSVFRAIKAATPGCYTFILPATSEVPRKLLHPKKRTVGVRIPEHKVAQAMLAEIGEPIVTTTLLLPGEEEPMTLGWEIKERLDHQVDAVIDSGDAGKEPTTVIDFSSGARRGRPQGRRGPVTVRVTTRGSPGVGPLAGDRFAEAAHGSAPGSRRVPGGAQTRYAWVVWAVSCQCVTPAWSTSSITRTTRIDAMKTASSTSAAAVSANATASSPRTRDTPTTAVSVLPARSNSSPVLMTTNAAAPSRRATADMPRGSSMNGISPLTR